MKAHVKDGIGRKRLFGLLGIEIRWFMRGPEAMDEVNHKKCIMVVT